MRPDHDRTWDRPGNLSAALFAGALALLPLSAAAAAGVAGVDDSLATRPVISLPEEIVQAPGVRFGALGDVRVVFPAREALRTPGAFGDPARFVQQLPGVGNGSDLDGFLFVRGGEADHTRILLDQVSVSDPYHFGGVVSFLNADVIDELEFVPGGYGADYGDALGGLLRVRRRVGNPYHFRSTASVSLTTANATLEGPLGPKGSGSWLIAGRRSYLDHVLSARSVGQAVLPSYFDLDSRLYRRLGGHQVRLGLTRSGDAVSARLSDHFTFAPADSGGLTWDRVLTLANASWEYAPRGWALSQTLSHAWRDQAVTLHGTVPQQADGLSRIFDWRGDARRLLPQTEVSAGMQVVHTHYDYDLDFNRLSLERPDRSSDPRSPLDTVRTVIDAEGRNTYLAGYTQVRREIVDSALVVHAGLRLEHASGTGQTEPMPRLRVEWRTPWSVIVSGAAGSYRQYPVDRIEVLPGIGSPDLLAERARHLTLGVAWPMAHGGRLSIEGYHKNLDHLIAYEPDAPEGSPRFASTGSGTARGIEVLAHWPSRRLEGWASYTLGEVRYQDRPGDLIYAPAQDLRHLVSLSGHYKLARGWSLGLKWRAHSGRPYTPVIGRENVSEYVEGIEWVPVEGAFHSARFPWYHRLDVRAERDFRIGGARASAFLEILNLYGRQNLYDYRYVDGFSRAVPVTTLPFLPTLGFAVSL
jgi:hypothetical protein